MPAFYDKSNDYYVAQLEAIKARDGVKLNVGCGPQVWPGWVGLDAYPSSPYVVKAGMSTLPFPDNTFDALLSSHSLEHVPIDEGVKCVAEFRRALKTGGNFYLAVPDMDNICRIMLDESISYEQKWNWYVYTMYGYQADTNTTPDLRAGRFMDFDPGQVHYVTFTKERLQRILTGFEIKEMYTYDGWGTPTIFCHAVKL